MKIRCMIISKGEWMRLPYNIAKRFDVSKKGNIEVYIACLSPYLISKVNRLIERQTLNVESFKRNQSKLLSINIESIKLF